MAGRRNLFEIVRRKTYTLNSGKGSRNSSWMFSRHYSLMENGVQGKRDKLSTTGKILIGSGIFTGIVLSRKASAQGHRNEPGIYQRLGNSDPRESPSPVLHSRIRGDVCRLAPNLSDLVVDITELLKEKHSSYIAELMRHKEELEKSLTERRSTQDKGEAIRDLTARYSGIGAEERLHWSRSEYQATLQKLDDVIQSINLVASAARTLGADSCLDTSESAVREAMFVRDSIVQVVQQSEERMQMAEKLYRSRTRREGKEHKTRLT